MAEISGTIRGDDHAARQLNQAAERVTRATQDTTRTWGAALQTAVRARASGRPGPRAQTGDYRRSISFSYSETAEFVTSRVGTNAPQGRRLEFGFAPGIPPQGGVDVLGRRFHQAPLPHFGPAADEVKPRYDAALRAAVRKAVEG